MSFVLHLNSQELCWDTQHSPRPSDLPGATDDKVLPCILSTWLASSRRHPALHFSHGVLSFRYHDLVWDLINNYGHLHCMLSLLQSCHTYGEKKKSTHFYYDESYVFLNIDFKNGTSGEVKFLLYVRMTWLLFLSQINNINLWLLLLCSIFLNRSWYSHLLDAQWFIGSCMLQHTISPIPNNNNNNNKT